MHQKNEISWPLLGLALALVLSLIFFIGKSGAVETKNLSSADLKVIKINSREINVEVANTPASMALGLGGRDGLKDGDGMWFIFPEEGRHGFWMKDMKFSIDIIWFDQNGKIVTIKEDASPLSFPEVFYPERDSRFVLEVPADFSKNNEMKLNDRAEVIE